MKTLSESAAEILKASMTSGKEPVQTPSGEIEDLGGATTENPGGNAVGSAAATNVAQAPESGVASDDAEKNKKPAIPDQTKPLIGPVETNLQGESTESDEDIIEEVNEREEKIDLKSQAKELSDTAFASEPIKESMKADVDALFNGESLSEEFKNKAITIFEAAVKSKVEAIVESILIENDSVLEEAIGVIKEEMEASVDEYLSEAVAQWAKDNEVAIESGLRTEIAEDFMQGLKDLFTEHYIEVPESKVDVVDALAEEVETLQTSIAEKDATLKTISESLIVALKNESIRKICEGLTEVQVSKMKSLAESVEFTTEGDFNTKLAVIRENYFTSKTIVKNDVKSIVEDIPQVSDQEVAEPTGLMNHYVSSIAKTTLK